MITDYGKYEKEIHRRIGTPDARTINKNMEKEIEKCECTKKCDEFHE